MAEKKKEKKMETTVLILRQANSSPRLYLGVLTEFQPILRLQSLSRSSRWIVEDRAHDKLNNGLTRK
jgi:hypothetical protein